LGGIAATRAGDALSQRSPSAGAADAPARLPDSRESATVDGVTLTGENPTEFISMGKLTKKGDKRKATCHQWHAAQNGSRSLRPSPCAQVGNRLTTSGIEPPDPAPAARPVSNASGGQLHCRRALKRYEKMGQLRIFY